MRDCEKCNQARLFFVEIMEKCGIFNDYMEASIIVHYISNLKNVESLM